MDRRRILIGCGCTGLLAGPLAHAQVPASAAGGWQRPERFVRPEISTDEGGLWSMMDREEARLKRSPFLLDDPDLRRYLTDIVCRLTGSHCPDVRVYPLRMPWANASMAPNGMMQVWSGMLLRLDNEAQLAAILGHEIGHYLSRHTVERLRDARSRAAFAALMLPFGLVGLIGQLAAVAGQFAFSREQERDADRIGLDLMAGAGYEPMQAAEVWAQLLAEVRAGEAAGGDPARNSVIFATHPDPAERQDELRARAVKASGPHAANLGAERFRKAVRPFRRSLLDDELRRRRPGETMHLLQRMIAADGRDGELLYYLAEVHRQRGTGDDAQRALELYDEASAMEGSPPELFRGRGLLRLQRGDRPGAQADFRQYLERAPGAKDADMVRSYIKGD